MPPNKDPTKAAPGKRLEDDELFKQIGGQLDANFDYSQWQRSGKTSDGKLKGKKTVGQDGEISAKAKPTFMVASGAGVSRGSRPAPCQHGKPKKYTASQAHEQAKAKKKAEQIKILNLRIRARRQTIGEYRKREAELLLSNMTLRDEIIAEEKDAHEDVKKLLRKYEKYRGGINTLNDQFVDDLAEAKSAVDATKSKVEKELSVLQNQVDEFDKKLTAKLDELHILMNYKDKEYAVKSLRISELQTEIAELEVNQEEEENDLQHMVETELDKFKREENRVKSSVTEAAAEEVLTKMHPSLKDLGIQNVVMEKEIEFHKNEIIELEQQNKELDRVVKRLLKDPKTSIRQQMFPEFYPTLEKCTPDMEVVLDIPVHDWLPI